MGNTVTSIGAFAFCDCEKLSDIELSTSLTTIAESTFRYCRGLTEIVIPEGVTTICSSAFYNCYLTSLTIPSTLTYVEDSAFLNCHWLTDIYISDITAWMNIEFHPRSSCHIMDASKFDKTLYLNGTPVTELVIPDGTLEIASRAFYRCNFTSVTFPSSLTTIHDRAFTNCGSLENVVIPDQVTQIGDSAFGSCQNLTSVTIGKNVTDIGAGAFGNCEKLQQITIPDSVTTMGRSVFAGCSALTNVTLSKELTQISGNMFNSCSSLVSISIPRKVSTIGEFAFEKCTSLTSVDIGEGVTAIERSAFFHCESLKCVTLPDTLTVLGKQAFSHCTSLTDVVFGKNLEIIEYKAFADCSSLVNVKLPDNLTTIKSYAFDLCPKYKMLVLPASIQVIDTGAFYITWHVLFKGTESQWNAIHFDAADTKAPNRKTVHFNCTGDELPFEVIAPTCTAFGYTAYQCTRCNAVRHENVVESPGHSYGSWYITKEATFASTGIERRDCNNCNEYESRDTPVKTHTDQNNDLICDDCGSKYCTNHTEQLLPGKNATCSQDGLTDGKKCADCNVILQVQEIIPASGHNYGEWKPITNPSTEGLEERLCDLCGQKEQRKSETLTSTPTSPLPSEPISTLPTTQLGTIHTEPVLSDGQKTSDNHNPIIIVVIITAAVAIAAGTTGVFIKRRNRK
jgi:hypothetical protein